MAKKSRKKARRSSKRRKSSNPKRSHKRRHLVRAHYSNPKKRSHKRRRTSNPRRHYRRNPAGKSSSSRRSSLLHAIGGAVLGFAGSFAAAQLVTKDPATQGDRNRLIAGVLGGAAGAMIAKKKPMLGIGIAAGSVLAAIGGYVFLALAKYLPSPSGTTSAVFADNMMGYRQVLGALGPADQILSGYEQQLGAVFADNMSGYDPVAPWKVATPYDSRGY